MGDVVCGRKREPKLFILRCVGGRGWLTNGSGGIVMVAVSGSGRMLYGTWASKLVSICRDWTFGVGGTVRTIGTLLELSAGC